MFLDHHQTFLLLGSNLGDSKLILESAIEMIEEKVGQVLLRSNFFETAAWGKTDQPNFLNIALGVETILQPKLLLQTVLAIEEQLGRVRKEKWGARLIDIDILLYDDAVINIVDELTIPHPEMHNRKFVMEPLVTIAPEVIHPILKVSMSNILQNLTDSLTVKEIIY